MEQNQNEGGVLQNGGATCPAPHVSESWVLTKDLMRQQLLRSDGAAKE
jgi:hypothetical protein